MARFIHEGKSIDYTPGAAVAAGDVVVQGNLVGIAALSIEANRLGALTVAGVFDIAKATGTGKALTVGTKVYWNGADKVVTADDDNGGTPATAYPYVGKVVQAASDTDVTVRVRLEQ